MTILNKLQPELIDTSEADNQEKIEDVLLVEAKSLLEKKRAKAQQRSQMADMRDTQYYCVVVFGNKNDKDKFIDNIEGEVEIMGETFIDGYELASFMGLELPCTASLPKPHFVKQIKVKSDGNSIRGRR
jgi:hypothetical protein